MWNSRIHSVKKLELDELTCFTRSISYKYLYRKLLSFKKNYPLPKLRKRSTEVSPEMEEIRFRYKTTKMERKLTLELLMTKSWQPGSMTSATSNKRELGLTQTSATAKPSFFQFYSVKIL